MKTHAARALAIVLAGVMGVVTACGSARPEPQQKDHLAVSRVHVYTSVRELAQDADVIVLARILDDPRSAPADQRDASGPIRDALSSIEVRMVLAGAAQPGERATLRQLDVRDVSAEAAAVVARGREYVLFGTDVSAAWGSTMPIWHVTGGVGLYEVTDFGLIWQASAPDTLPKTIESLAALRALLHQ